MQGHVFTERHCELLMRKGVGAAGISHAGTDQRCMYPLIEVWVCIPSFKCGFNKSETSGAADARTGRDEERQR
jgi:hypothetical protein